MKNVIVSLVALSFLMFGVVGCANSNPNVPAPTTQQVLQSNVAIVTEVSETAAGVYLVGIKDQTKRIATAKQLGDIATQIVADVKLIDTGLTLAQVEQIANQELAKSSLDAQTKQEVVLVLNSIAIVVGNQSTPVLALTPDQQGQIQVVKDFANAAANGIIQASQVYGK